MISIEPRIVKCTTQNERMFLNRLVASIYQVQQYRTEKFQKIALSLIPVFELQEKATKTFKENPNSSFKDELLKAALHWFKASFFKWVNSPPCEKCKKKTKGIGSSGPNLYEKQGHASRVEIYQCSDPTCKTITRFPRYNHSGRLMETKKGRCGEWAQAFSLIASALGYEVRFCLDWTDHVWVEVYSDHLKRYVHCDCCENKFDNPLMYEHGWKKKLSFVIGFGCDRIVDVTPRYTTHWSECLKRRNVLVSENWVTETLNTLNTQLEIFVVPQRMKILKERLDYEEKNEFFKIREAKDEEKGGRISGDTEWKKQRGEYIPFHPNNYEYHHVFKAYFKGIKKKLFQYNNQTTSNSKIENMEEIYEQIIKIYNNYETEKPSDSFINQTITEKFLSFHNAKIFPFLDIIRSLLKNQYFNITLLKNEQILRKIVQISNESTKTKNFKNLLMILRFFLNIFKFKEVRDRIIGKPELLISFVKDFDVEMIQRRDFQKGYCQLLFNLSLLISLQDENMSLMNERKEMIKLICEKVIGMDSIKKSGEDCIKLLMNSVGVLCFGENSLFEDLKKIVVTEMKFLEKLKNLVEPSDLMKNIEIFLKS